MNMAPKANAKALVLVEAKWLRVRIVGAVDVAVVGVAVVVSDSSEHIAKRMGRRKMG